MHRRTPRKKVPTSWQILITKVPIEKKMLACIRPLYVSPLLYQYTTIVIIVSNAQPNRCIRELSIPRINQQPN
jgi:hypothetical protein